MREIVIGAAQMGPIQRADSREAVVARMIALLEQAKSVSYRAPPVRRVHIPKGTSGKEKRPIGIPTVYPYCTSFTEI